MVLAALGLLSSCDLYCKQYGTCGGAGGPGGGTGGFGQADPRLDAGFGGAGGSCGGQGRGSELATPIVPARTPPPVTGGNLAAVGDGTWVIADADRATIWHVGESDVFGATPLADDDFPGRVLIVDGAQGKRAIVALRRAGQLAVLDLTTHELVRWSTCVEPRGLALRGEEILVGCATGVIEALSPTGERKVISNSDRLHDLRDLEVVNDRLLVSTFRDAQVFELIAGEPRLLSNPVSAVAVRGQSAVPRVAWRLRQGLLLAQDEQLSTLPPLLDPNDPFASCSPTYGGGGLVSAGGGAGSGQMKPGPISSVLYRVAGDQLVPVGEITEAVVAVDMLETDQFVFVASVGTNSVVKIEKFTGIRSTISLPGQPTSLAFTGNGFMVWVRDPARLMQYSATGNFLRYLEVSTTPAFSTGHDLFHRATRIGIACASCHPEAGDDGHTWPFAEGARRTPSLRGGLSGTEPFHWDGAEANMDALLIDVMSGRMSGPSQSLERTQALVDWLDRQPALRAPPVDQAAVARGRALFESGGVGCASCHSGVQGTNNQFSDVGTGAAFQVPRLTEAYWRTPLMHDGSVPTLEARVFSTRPSTLHGRLDHLTSEERADLLEYLKTR